MSTRPHHRARRLLALLALASAAAVAATAPASAQGVVVLVNGDPITNFDVEQRVRLTQISTQKVPARPDVVQELIDEKLKLGLLKRFAIEGIDADVESSFSSMARRAGLSADSFTQQLAKSNVAASTLKQRIKADLTWSQIVRGRYQSSFQFSDRDIRNKMQTGGEAQAATGFDYTLRPITFIVPRGAPQGTAEARRRDAEALRGRFQNCQQGIAIARTLRDVAVRAPVIRSTGELSQQLREILEKTQIGQLSAPEATDQGIEAYALCGKKPSSSENAPGKREAREALVSAEFKQKSELFLKELRGQAMIEYKN